MSFVRNSWYVAALSSEIEGDALFSRILLNEPVLLYRNTNGSISAMSDRCPHRFAPLHLGKRDKDTVACPYHGLMFDSSGTCIFSPHGDRQIPPLARLAKFNAVERYGAIWIWMGDEAQADPDLIPDYDFANEGVEDSYFEGYLHSNAHYQLLIDNILDLSHADFLHPTLLAAGTAVTQQRPKVRDHGRGIKVSWEWENAPTMSVFAPGLPSDTGNTDGWLWVEWEPVGSMMLHSGATPTGSAREQGVWLSAYHCMTPETEKSTHYFYGIRRNYCVDPEMNKMIAGLTRTAFSTEDKPIIEAVQRYMGNADLWSLNPAILSSDVGAVRVRRATEKLLRAECRTAGDVPKLANRRTRRRPDTSKRVT